MSTCSRLKDLEKRKASYGKLVDEYREQEQAKAEEQQEQLQMQNDRIKEIQVIFSVFLDNRFAAGQRG